MTPTDCKLLRANTKPSIKVIIGRVRAGQDFWLWDICTSGMVYLSRHRLTGTGGTAMVYPVVGKAMVCPWPLGDLL